MSDAVKVGFVAFSAAPRGVLVVFCDDALKFGEATRKALGTASDQPLFEGSPWSGRRSSAVYFLTTIPLIRQQNGRAVALRRHG